jgi:hypothetical protein
MSISKHTTYLPAIVPAFAPCIPIAGAVAGHNITASATISICISANYDYRLAIAGLPSALIRYYQVLILVQSLFYTIPSKHTNHLICINASNTALTT